jgi:carbon storage regulator CsrA
MLWEPSFTFFRQGFVMLVLSRKLQERISIVTASGQAIILQITDIEAGRVRIGIQASQDVIISREELIAKEDWETIELLSKGR